MTLLELVPPDDDKPDQPGPIQARVERVPPLPRPARIRAGAWWWATTGAARLGAALVRAPYTALCELRPIAVGFGRIVASWSRWCSASTLEAGLKAADQHHEKHALEVERRKEGRRRISAFLFLLAVGAGWTAAVRWPAALLIVCGALVVVCDAVGRKVSPSPVHVPAPARVVLRDGVPLTQITRTLVEVATREGLELGVARAMRYDAARREYRVTVTCLDQIEAKHLRAFERGLGAADHAIRSLATGEATSRELVIRDGDPLAVHVDRDWIPTGTRSVAEPLDVGVSLTEVPFALTFAGVHMRVVMASGGGKTKWFLRACIDRVSACRDAVVWGADITNGPELSLWRGVVQRRATTPEEADALLDAAIAEIDRRGRILTAIAEDDDPDNDVDEWHAGLGPALVIFFDEFAQAAVYNGKGDRLNLLGKAEQIVRTGRKHWVSLVMLTQRTGNDDFGSTTMSSQCAVTIAGACEPADTVRMFGVERRDGGYAPHLLSPGVEGDPRDAGKVFISSPTHRTPDMYRAYAPGSTAEVKRRARQRIADGLPSLHGPAEDAVEAVEVPASLLLLERVFAEHRHQDRVPSAVVLAADEAVGWSAESLADALRPHGVTTRKARSELAGGRAVMCYFRVEVDAALGAL
jgi:hypothetical protein